MINEIIDYMIDEKIDYKKYKELADEMESEEYRDMFNMISEQEHTHYKMMKEFLTRMMESKEDN